ncbi:MAG: hypothetical protein J7J06_00245, partial [Methanosarcinales archaeon]|nr:hypothetical protein [Methanosarcinales archaeon]
AAVASRGVATDAPPVGAWKCRRGVGRRVYRRRAAVGMVVRRPIRLAIRYLRSIRTTYLS